MQAFYEYLTLGQLYFISRTVQTKFLEDKDFQYSLVSGKSLIEQFDNPSSVLYDPVETVGAGYESVSTHISHGKQQTNTTVHPTKKYSELHSKLLECLTRIEQEKNTRQHEALSRSLRNVENVPHHTAQVLVSLKQKIKTPAYFSMNEYLTLITKYIKDPDSVAYSKKDIKLIIEYLMLAFIGKNENDFPHIDINETKINDLIKKTRDMDKDHPMKWTTARKRLIYNLSDPYHKLLHFDGLFAMWNKFSLDDIPLTNITPIDIRTKYIMDAICTGFSYEYSTVTVLFRNLDKEIIKRLREVFAYIKEVYTENKSEFGVYTMYKFFINEQIDNQYVLKDDCDILKLREKTIIEYNTRTPTALQVLEYLIKHEQVQKTDIIINENITDS